MRAIVAVLLVIVSALASSCIRNSSDNKRKDSPVEPLEATAKTATAPSASDSNDEVAIPANAASATLRVTKMECPNTCTERAKVALKTLEGIHHVDIDFYEKTAEVKYDDASCEIADMVAVLEQTGFGAWDVATETRRIPGSAKQ